MNKFLSLAALLCVAGYSNLAQSADAQSQGDSKFYAEQAEVDRIYVGEQIEGTRRAELRLGAPLSSFGNASNAAGNHQPRPVTAGATPQLSSVNSTEYGFESLIEFYLGHYKEKIDPSITANDLIQAMAGFSSRHIERSFKKACRDTNVPSGKANFDDFKKAIERVRTTFPEQQKKIESKRTQKLLLSGLISATVIGSFSVGLGLFGKSDAAKALKLQERALELQIQQTHPSDMIEYALKVPFAAVVATGKIVLDPFSTTHMSISTAVNASWTTLVGK